MIDGSYYHDITKPAIATNICPLPKELGQECAYVYQFKKHQLRLDSYYCRSAYKNDILQAAADKQLMHSFLQKSLLIL